MRTLESEGWGYRDLFPVEGDLVARYNSALDAAVGRTTTLTSFRVDRRGESPEVSAELGEDYLRRGPSDRYIIVVSPSQRDADLIHEEFSFDREILDALYDRHLGGLGLVTRVDALWGELDDGVRLLDRLEDLLLLHEVRVELRTPTDFLERARELQQGMGRLRADPQLLVEDDSSLLHRIQELSIGVGDVREHDLSDLGVERPIGTFYANLFDGAYVFRSEGARSVVLHGPDAAPSRASPAVDFVPLDDMETIVRFLIENRLAEYAADRLEERLVQIENERIAESGLDLRRAGSEERRQALSELADRMPAEWRDLIGVKRSLAAGHPIHQALRGTEPAVWGMLLRAKDTRDAGRTVESLLSRFCPQDHVQAFRHRRRELETRFRDAPGWEQNLILHSLEHAAEEARSV